MDKVCCLCSSASTLIFHPEEKHVCQFQGTCKVSFSKPTQGLSCKILLTLNPIGIHTYILMHTSILFIILYYNFKTTFIFPYWIAAHLGFIYLFILYPWHLAWKLICFDSP